ncbi:MAG: DUF4446 family protein [Cellulosilyticaceae bacterium]
MEQILTLLEQYNIYIVIGLAILLLITFIMLVATMSKVKKIQRKYETFMQKDDLDLENLLIHYAKKVNKVKDMQCEVEDQIKDIRSRMQYCTQKTGVVRYNAYEKGGADLSFAVALLDEKDTGVVLNGIYGRDGCYIYAKPIEEGTSKHNLSEEEIQAIHKARNYNKAISE